MQFDCLKNGSIAIWSFVHYYNFEIDLGSFLTCKADVWSTNTSVKWIDIKDPNCKKKSWF